MEGHGIAEALQAANQSLFHPLSLQLIKVCDTEFVIGLTPHEDVVDHHQDRMPERDECTLFVPASSNAAILLTACRACPVRAH